MHNTNELPPPQKKARKNDVSNVNTYPSLWALIKSDFKRFESASEALLSASFPVTFWFRICSWLMRKGRLNKIVAIPFVLIYKFHKLATGIQLPVGTKVGPGLRFFHYNCIIIAQQTIIGRNASIHQGVTIGRVFNGDKEGVPTIGDNVVLFSGAKVIGKISLGDNVVVGANAVAVSDVPSNSVCVGVPAKIISDSSHKCFDAYWSKVFKINE